MDNCKSKELEPVQLLLDGLVSTMIVSGNCSKKSSKARCPTVNQARREFTGQTRLRAKGFLHQRARQPCHDGVMRPGKGVESSSHQVTPERAKQVLSGVPCHRRRVEWGNFARGATVPGWDRATSCANDLSDKGHTRQPKSSALADV